MILALGATAGLAYAGVVWRPCVRPRLVRDGSARQRGT